MVGKTGCGKTTFVQKLAVNNFFGDVKKVEWVSQIELSKFWEAEIHSYFSAPVEPYSPSKVDELEDLVLHFIKISAGETEDNNSIFKDENVFGEKEKTDSLIVMDDVSGLADRFNDFTSQLAVARSFK